jgi:hypothetical protein
MSHPSEPYTPTQSPMTRVELKNRLKAVLREAPVRLHRQIEDIADAMDVRGIEGCGPFVGTVPGGLAGGPPLGGHMPPKAP